MTALPSYQLIAQAALTSTADYTFTGLNGDIDLSYLIELSGTTPAIANKIIGIRPNGETSNYGKGVMFQYYRNGGTAFATEVKAWEGTTDILPLASNAFSAAGWLQAYGRIAAPSGVPRIIKSTCTFLRDSSLHDYTVVRETTNAWLNTATNITSLVLHFGGMTSFSGVARIYALRS